MSLRMRKMPSFRIKTLQVYELEYLIEAESEEEAVSKAQSEGNYYQKAQDEKVLRIRKTKMSTKKFHDKMNSKGFF